VSAEGAQRVRRFGEIEPGRRGPVGYADDRIYDDEIKRTTAMA